MDKHLKNQASATRWVWVILIILTLPSAIQWAVSRMYSEYNVLNDMRFARLIERTCALDKLLAVDAKHQLVGQAFDCGDYTKHINQLAGAMASLPKLGRGRAYLREIEALRSASGQRRDFEAAKFEAPPGSEYNRLQYRADGELFERTAQQMIARVENRTAKSLEKTQLVTSAIQYTIIAFAFFAFFAWRQHARRQEAEIRQAEYNHKLEQAKRAAEDTHRLKSQFLADLSHEMRTPLTAIIGMSHLCRHAELDDLHQSRIDHIESTAANLLKVINDVRDLSKIELDRLELERVPFQINDLYDQLDKSFEKVLAEKDIELQFETDRDIPLLIGDPYRLGQVLSTLVSHAIEFTEPGCITVSAELLADIEPVPGETDPVPAGPAPLEMATPVQVRFSVAVTATGRESTQLERIFEMFTQGASEADGSTDPRYGGSGLGLFICQNILAAMHSTIQVTSRPDRGSCFSTDIGFQTPQSVDNPLLNPVNLKVGHPSDWPCALRTQDDTCENKRPEAPWVPEQELVDQMSKLGQIVQGEVEFNTDQLPYCWDYFSISRTLDRNSRVRR